MRRLSIRSVRLFLASVAVGVGITGVVGTAAAQRVYHDSLKVAFDDDTVRLARINGEGVIYPAEWFTSGYFFEINSDSICRTEYRVAGFKINERRWKLRNWKYFRIINYPADYLSFNSRTLDTTLHAGDTLSFYRELVWRDPLTRVSSIDNFRSLDTLSYTVELVRASDGVRLAVMDSIGLMPRQTVGAPVVYGKHPVIAFVDWVVPPTLDGVRAFARVRVRANGSGQENFTRTECVQRLAWKQPYDSWTVDWLNYFGHVYGKPAVGGAQQTESSLLRLLSIAGVSDAVTLEFSTSPSGPTLLAVYDGVGRLVFYPYNSPSSDGGQERVDYRFESSGLYLVMLVHDGKPVATRTITVGR